MPESTGYVVVWPCFCSDADDDPATLPVACPGHGRTRTVEPVKNEHPGPTTPGHACRQAPCPTRPEETA